MEFYALKQCAVYTQPLIFGMPYSVFSSRQNLFPLLLKLRACIKKITHCVSGVHARWEMNIRLR